MNRIYASYFSGKKLLVLFFIWFVYFIILTVAEDILYFRTVEKSFDKTTVNWIYYQVLPVQP